MSVELLHERPRQQITATAQSGQNLTSVLSLFTRSLRVSAQSSGKGTFEFQLSPASLDSERAKLLEAKNQILQAVEEAFAGLQGTGSRAVGTLDGSVEHGGDSDAAEKAASAVKR